MPTAASILKVEFAQLFQRCIPLTGWPSTIAVANSGGPDSTCLLYLLSSLIRKGGQPGVPHRLVSLHINHGLQSASKDMAERAAQSARDMDVEHRSFTIPWSTAPYPDFPAQSSVELHARNARLRALFDLMTEEGADALALGHHADDQAETTILRSSFGSGMVGLGGMQPVRRWGMGNNHDDLTFFGRSGMKRWMIRPFLSVPKDRIIATCEQNGLDYAVDPTNSKPCATRRNAIRHVLGSPHFNKSAEHDIHHASIRALFGELQSRDDIRERVRSMGEHLEMVISQVDNYMARCLLPTWPSTLLLSSSWLDSIPDEVRDVLIRRFVRYTSPHPWGSNRAQARGSRTTHATVIERLCAPSTELAVPFVPGASVLFKPGVLDQHDCFALFDDTRQGWRHAWRVQRAPPHKKRAPTVQEMHNPLEHHITSMLSQWHPGDQSPEILHDNRFLLRFDMAGAPEGLLTALRDDSTIRVLVRTHGPEYIPRVVMKDDKREVVIADYGRDVLGLDGEKRRSMVQRQTWVQMELVRTLEAV